MKLDYRPEIDGLRSVAVISVLIYHAQFVVGGYQLLPGGFLGVDVFFVISGFLITSLIKQEYEASGRFSYSQFYERRARRLLPALLVVLLACLPFAWQLLLPSQLVDFAQSLLASLFFASNHYWHIVTQAYGAESALLRPLLHTWSLAVEEQYYLLFPIFLVALLRGAPSAVGKAIIALAVASFALAVFTSGQHQEFAFYLLPTRLWELAAGSLLAFYPRSSREARWYTGALPLLGLLGIFLSVSLVEFGAGHPGWATLLPIVGTMLVLRYSGQDRWATAFLASRPMVAIGLISYSLYLWHYPLLAFLRIAEPAPSDLLKAGCLLMAVLASVASYFLVEKPFRNRRVTGLPSLLSFIGAGMILLVAFSVWVISQDGLKQRFPELMAIYGKNEFDNRVLTREANSLWKELAQRDGFTDDRGVTGIGPSDHEAQHLWFSDSDATRKVLLIGNSHSRDLFNALYQNKELFPGSEFARFELRNRLLNDEMQLLFAAPNYQRAELVIVSFRLRNYTFEKLPQLVDTLLKDGKEVVLVSSFHGFDAIDGLAVFDWYVRQPETRSTFSSDELNRLYYQHQVQDNGKVLNRKLLRLAGREGVTFVDKSEIVCQAKQQKCFGITPSGYKTHHDADHWTLRGAAFFGKRIHKRRWLEGIE